MSCVLREPPEILIVISYLEYLILKKQEGERSGLISIIEGSFPCNSEQYIQYDSAETS